MTTTLFQWQQFTEGLSPEVLPRPEILDSWRRSRAAGIDPVADEPAHRLASGDLQQRLLAATELLAVARPHLEMVSTSLAGAAHAAFVTDADGVVLFVTGNHPRAEVLDLVAGQNWSEQRVGTNGAGTALAARRSMLVEGHEHFRRALHGQTSAGAPVHDAQGHVAGAVGLLFDAPTGPGREQLALYLAHAVDRELAERRAARKDVFLEQLAHEIRNPLEPLLNALHILRMGENDPAIQAEAQAMAERQVHQLARLVDELLDVGRITRGKITLKKERVAVGTLVSEALAAVARPMIEGRHLQLSVLLPPEALHLEGDRARLVQVLTILLANAARNTEPGGHLWVNAERDGDDILLGVRDTGVGLPTDLLPHIFELFPNRPTGTHQARLGFGLNLARGLVELHGGSITALSDGPGEGSEFVVRLPAAAGDEPAAGPAVDARSLRVLVVDDDIDGAQSLSRLLQMWRHEVQVAHEGLTALEVARAWRPQVVLLDIGLPGGLDGFQVARRLREEVGLDAAVLIALTGWGQEEDRRKSSAAGFNHHLVKPVDPHTLQQLLDSRRVFGEGNGKIS